MKKFEKGTESTSSSLLAK